MIPPSKDPTIPIDLSRVERALVIQTAYLGDLVRTTPLIQTLSRALPGGLIDVLVIPQTAEAIKGLAEVGEVLIYDKRRRLGQFPQSAQLWRKLKEKRYQLVVCPHLSLRSALVASASRARWRVSFAESSAPYLFTHLVPYDPNIHIVERYLALAKALGVGEIVPDLHLRATAEAKAFAERSLREIKGRVRGLLAVFCGSVWPTKRYPAEMVALAVQKTAPRLDFGAVLLGTKDERELAKEVEGGLKVANINLAGETNLSQLKGVLESCDLCLANDSGGLHLALALGVPTVGVYGPTLPSQGIGPWGEHGRAVFADVECSPCGTHGGKSCPRGDFACMKDISPSKVADALIDLHRKGRR